MVPSSSNAHSIRSRQRPPIHSPPGYSGRAGRRTGPRQERGSGSTRQGVGRAARAASGMAAVASGMAAAAGLAAAPARLAAAPAAPLGVIWALPRRSSDYRYSLARRCRTREVIPETHLSSTRRRLRRIRGRRPALRCSRSSNPRAKVVDDNRTRRLRQGRRHGLRRRWNRRCSADCPTGSGDGAI